MNIPADELQELERLRQLNLTLQAYELAKRFGDFSEWTETKAILAASNLTYNLGAIKESSRLTSRAWHRDRTNPEAVFFFAIEILQTRGPLPALLFTRRFPDYRADDVFTAWWYSLIGELHSSLRDFAEAEQWHAKAIDECPGEAWVWVAKAFTLEQQDRYEQALEFAQKAVTLEPLRRSSVSAAAHYLTLLEQNDEALRLLSSTIEKVENGWLVKQLAELQTELGLHAEAYESVQKCFSLFPRLEEKTGEWLYGALSDGAYLVGDTERAIEYAEKASNPFHKKILDNLKGSDGSRKRKLLDVRFLRQHHVTCAPATLSNLGRYWNRKAEHLDLVEQMCYDGTPSYKERIWAESNGWIAREFTLNWSDAVALLDRGVPLTLATVYPGGGHLQAIIGYDEARRTYLIRDPYYQRVSEFLADELLESQKASGPRVMALVPAEQKELLDGLEKPLAEAEIYDLLYAVESNLEIHKREDAGAALDELKKRFPDHRLRYVAEWTISAYDSNSLGIRSALTELLKLFPEDVNLRMSDIRMSSEFTGRLERIKTLEEYSRAKTTDPLIWQMFGYELSLDAKQHQRALHWLWKSLRKAPGDPISYRLVADVLWARRRFEDAALLYRFASSLNDKNEQLAYSYFLAMRNLKREDEALEVLSDRVTRFGKLSSMPIRSLFSALTETGRNEQAFEALDKALRMRPDDGELILFAADAKATYGRMADAEKLLESAQTRAPRQAWLRTAARVAHLKGELADARAKWKEIAAEDPTAIDGHENIAYLTKGIEGIAATKEYLRRVCRRYPTNRSLQVLRLQHLNEEPGEAIAVLRDLIRRDSGDIWSLRELSYWYVQVGRFDRALEAAEQAIAADPNDAVSRWSLGRALEILKRYEDAGSEYKKSVGLNVDTAYSISNWLGISRSIESKRAALDFIWEQLNTQASAGDGLFAYRDEARRVIDRPTLLKNLETFAAENRRSWFAAGALIQQLTDMGMLDKAIETATEATRRFPLVYQIWLDASVAHRLAGNVEEEIDALRTAISLNPVWSYGIQQLADTYQRAGRHEEARDLLIEGLRRLPFDNYLLGYLAQVYWAVGQKEDAIETAKRAIAIEPEYQWAWNSIKQWATQMGDPNLPVQLARELTEKKPRDVRSWINLADMLDTGIASQERLHAIEEALAIDPHAPTALVMKANLLADERRFDEAIEVTRSTMPDGYRPEQLRFVEAGIEAMRGDMKRSLDVLLDLTETSPSYLPGWLRLADHYRANPDRKHEYRKVAIELVRLAPREATAYGYLAEACLQLEMKDEARNALEQAVILDPTYEFAVGTLFELLVEKDDLTDAKRLVESLRLTSPVTGLPIAVELAVRAKDREKTLETLRELLKQQDIVRARLEAVFSRVTELFGRKDPALLETLRDVCKSEKVNPVAGRLLIDRVWAAEWAKGCERELDVLRGNSRLWAHAASRYLECLASEQPARLLKFIDANAESLAAETESWGAAGYHLTSIDEMARSMKWFDGWEKRPDLMPWMLWNYSIALRRGGKAEEADKINSAALGLRYDDTVNMHVTMLALSEIKSGRFEQAAAMFSGINPHGMTAWDRFFYEVLNESIWANERLENGDREQAKALIDSIVDKIIAFDRKAGDRIVTDLARGAVGVLLARLGDKWFALRKKAKLFYYEFL